MVLSYPMIFLSRAAISREVLSESIRQFAQVLPLSHVVTLLRGLWVGDSWGNYPWETVILITLLIAVVLVSSKTFRWE